MTFHVTVHLEDFAFFKPASVCTHLLGGVEVNVQLKSASFKEQGRLIKEEEDPLKVRDSISIWTALVRRGGRQAEPQT